MLRGDLLMMPHCPYFPTLTFPSSEDLNKNCAENKKSVEPSDQYVVLVTGLLCFLCKKTKKRKEQQQQNVHYN